MTRQQGQGRGRRDQDDAPPPGLEPDGGVHRQSRQV